MTDRLGYCLAERRAPIRPGISRPDRGHQHRSVRKGSAHSTRRPLLPRGDRRGVEPSSKRLVHGYWQIDLDIIADVIDSNLNPLISELEKLIKQIERSDP
jgi:hypothetical protein